MFNKSLFCVLFVGLVCADLKDFPDTDAFYLAQRQNQSLLEPPKELYEEIHKELEMIRKAYPVLAHIRGISNLEQGKVICNKGIDLEKVNSSEYGPIKVEDIGHEEHLITFTRPYDTFQMERILIDKFGLPKASLKSCRSVSEVGKKMQVNRLDWEIFDKHGEIMYQFSEGSVGCFVFCRRTHYWTVNLKNGKIISEKESISDLDKPTTVTSRPRTTPKL